MGSHGTSHCQAPRQDSGYLQSNIIKEKNFQENGKLWHVDPLAWVETFKLSDLGSLAQGKLDKIPMSQEFTCRPRFS